MKIELGDIPFNTLHYLLQASDNLSSVPKLKHNIQVYINNSSNRLLGMKPLRSMEAMCCMRHYHHATIITKQPITKQSTELLTR